MHPFASPLFHSELEKSHVSDDMDRFEDLEIQDQLVAISNSIAFQVLLEMISSQVLSPSSSSSLPNSSNQSTEALSSFKLSFAATSSPGSVQSLVDLCSNAQRAICDRLDPKRNQLPTATNEKLKQEKRLKWPSSSGNLNLDCAILSRFFGIGNI